MAHNDHKVLETIERLAPGTELRQGIERILQQDRGAIIVIGGGPEIDDISSGGFALAQPVTFSPAKLGELAKMDGGIIVDDEGEQILAANVHFVPPNDIPTEETGSRHRTAERVSVHTGFPVVAVSERRGIATVYIGNHKVELRSPTDVAAEVNQELQTLDRLRRRLDEAELILTQLEIAELVTYRSVVTVLQRSELVRRVGVAIERETLSLGDEGRLAFIQLEDMVRGVTHTRDVTLRDYLSTRRQSQFAHALDALTALHESDLDDVSKVGKAVGFGDLDDPVTPRGYRLLSKVGRLPDNVREDLIKHFKTLRRLIDASVNELEKVEGIGTTRASHLRHYFDRVSTLAADWAPPAL